MLPRIALLGFMGSGKTSTGRILAARLGIRFVDTDSEAEARSGMPVKDIFRLQGERAFRTMEKEILASVWEGDSWVLSTGGGLWMDPSSREGLLEGAWCVWLKVGPEEVWRRVKDRLEERPLLAQALDPLGKIGELLMAREGAYALADVSMDTDGKTPAEVASSIEDLMRETKPFDLSSLPTRNA